MTTLLYLGPGDDLYPLRLALDNNYTNNDNTLVNKSCESGTSRDTIDCLGNVKIFILVDIVPKVKYYWYYPDDLVVFINYYTVLVKKFLDGTLIENNYQEKRLVFDLPHQKKLYYYYSTNLFYDQDPVAKTRKTEKKDFEPSKLLLEQLKSVDVNLIWGFYYDEPDDCYGFVDTWKKSIPNATTLITSASFNYNDSSDKENENLKYKGDEIKRFTENTKISTHLTLCEIKELREILL